MGGSLYSEIIVQHYLQFLPFLRHEYILQSFMLCQVDRYMNGHNYLFVYFKTATLL